ncbi:MAG: hypothetical protein PHQ23_13000 [Candidatus Wallbacteria bacterium]|nr:hypothetical protein [Candidatus Wallbacteria bacterium]
MDYNELLSTIHSLPKADLHCHLEGSLSPEIAWRIVSENKLSLPDNQVPDNFEDFLGMISIENQARDLLDFTGAYFRNLNCAVTCLDDLREFCSDLIFRASVDNVRLLEISFFPGYIAGNIARHTSSKPLYEEVIRTISLAVCEAESEYGLAAGLIVCLGSRDLRNKNYLARIVDLHKEFAASPTLFTPLCGIDIGDFDMDFLHPDQETEAFLIEQCRVLHNSGMNIKCHAGEAMISTENGEETAVAGSVGTTESIYRALRFGVSRIGHGLAAVQDQSLMLRLYNEKVHLEICPVSNYKTNLFSSFERQHPLRAFIEQGLSLSLCSDDSTIQRSTWDDDYLWAIIRLGLTIDEIRKTITSAYARTFIPEERKNRFRGEF